jgi:hypothetical protein
MLLKLSGDWARSEVVDVGGGAIARVSVVKEVEDEGAILNRLADVTKCINNLLHRLPVILNGHVSLSMRLLVCLLVGGDGCLELVRSLVGFHGKAKDRVGNGTVQPAVDVA